MAQFRAEKVVSVLPGTLEPDTVYYVRTGDGFDMYVSDATGSVAHRHNALVPAGGTAGQVLAKASATDYDGEWVDAPSGGGGGDIVLLQTIEITSPVAAVDITGLDRAAYPRLEIKFDGLRGTSNGSDLNSLAVRFSTDNGSTFDDGYSYITSVNELSPFPATPYVTSFSNSFGRLFKETSRNDRTWFEVDGLLYGLDNHMQSFGTVMTSSSGASYASLAFLKYKSPTLFNALRFYCSQPEWDLVSGTIKVYGVK